MTSIFKYMAPELVAFLDVHTCDEVLQALVDTLDAAGKLHDRQNFYDAIVERERIVSTGIGMGVAIPHAKLSPYKDFFIAIGVLQRGVEWKALDHAPVRLVFMIGGPDDKQTEYLKILSALTAEIKNEEARKKILTLNSKEAIIRLFSHED
ncbi:MAG: PTS sugar transporter subunit IIA [Parachlamydiaceae bacterium]